MPPRLNTADYCVRMADEFKTPAFWRDSFSELFATFLLIAANLILAQAPVSADSILQLALGMGFVWAAVGYGLGDFGGAHMNNAVTFACMIRAEISFLRALVYWIMQAAAAICAAFFVYAITPEDRRGDYGNTVVPDGVEWWQAAVMELFGAAILCMAYLASFNIERKGYVILSSLPVSAALSLAVFLTFPYSGASLNSMRSFGPAVVATIMDDDLGFWDDHWVYWVGPMGGALVAGIFFWIFDSVDAPEANQSPYAMSGTWGYNQEAPPRRPQVLPPPDEDYRPNGRMGGSELLNKPNGMDVHTVNRSANGAVSAYSNPPNGTIDDYLR